MMKLMMRPVSAGQVDRFVSVREGSDPTECRIASSPAAGKRQTQSVPTNMVIPDYAVTYRSWQIMATVSKTLG